MSKGQESNPHRVMSEAFALRLKALFPESNVSEGKVIRPVGLKPDIYIAHPDGRKWAYEVVHLNKSVKEIREKHHRYHTAGIRDYWVLWDDPHITMNSFSMGQGILLQETEGIRRVGPIGKLSDTIYSIHAEYFAEQGSVLYAFDYFNQLVENQHTPEFMKVMAFGVRVYHIQDYASGQDYLNAKREIISLLELSFSEDGLLLQTQDNEITSDVFEKVLIAQGLGDSYQPFIPEEMLKTIKLMANDPPKHAELVTVLLSAIFEKLSPDELAEIQAFGENGGLAELKQIDLSDLPIGGPVSMETGDGLVNVAQLNKAINQKFDSQDIPPALKKVFSVLFANGQIQALGEIMQWSETSDAVKGLQKETLK